MNATTGRRTWISDPAEVRAADPDTLLTAVEILTHRIHTATGSEQESDLRGQRLIVRNEILCRMGGAR